MQQPSLGFFQIPSARMSGCVYWPMAEKLSHNWLNAVFGVITLPDPIQLNSTGQLS
jgi:hypothetical protein